jgi:hypothetical protein
VRAHGAGAGMGPRFLNAFAVGLARRGIRAARFEFPYLAEHRRTGKRRPPDREPVLRETWLGSWKCGGEIAWLAAASRWAVASPVQAGQSGRTGKRPSARPRPPRVVVKSVRRADGHRVAESETATAGHGAERSRTAPTAGPPR